MSENIALLADGNSSAARRARVKLQPRDDKGRWVPTGAALLAGLRLPGGGSRKIKGKAIGGTATTKGEKNNIRMLVEGGYEDVGIAPNTVLTVDPKNATLDAKIKLDRDFLKKKGIDPDLQHTLPKSLADQPQSLEDMKPEKADDLDIELATGGLTDEEDADFKAERDAEPLAKLPPALAEGMEELSKVDIAKLLGGKPEKSGIFSKIKDYLGLNKSKMKKPDLTYYTRSKPQNYGQGFGVPGSNYGNFSYIDENGKANFISLSKLDDGRLRMELPSTGTDNPNTLEVRKTPEGKWGVYSKNRLESSYGGGNLLGEYESSDEARSAVFSGVNEALGFDKENIFGFGAGMTALRKRNENPRTKSQRDYIDLKVSQEFRDLVKENLEKEESSSSPGEVEPFDNKKKMVEDAIKNLKPLEGLDFTETTESDPYARPMPFGRSWKDPATGKVYKPVIPGVDNYEAIAVQDVFHEVNRGGSAGDIDQLIDKAKAPSSKNTKAAPDLKDGDVVVDPNGNNWTVVGKPKLNKLDNAKVDITLKNDKGQTTTTTAAMTRKFDLAQPAAKAPDATPPAKAPDAKAPDAPTPPTPKKTVAPPPPKPPTPKANTPKAPPVIPNNRKDTGADISPNSKPLADMQKVRINPLIDPNTGVAVRDKSGKPVEDPNAIYDALLENNPQAKIDANGSIILERQNFTDNDGRVWKYEVAVARTHGNKYMERYTLTNDKGETQSFYHYDYKDSFAAIYGSKNGVYVFRDQLLGKNIPGKKPPTRDTLNYFGSNKTIEDRLRFFRGKKSANSEVTLDDLNKSSFKMLTPQEVIQKFLEGRGEKYNLSGQARGTKLQSFIGSAWEALDADDMPTFEARMLQLLGRLPDDESSRNLLINTLRGEISKKYNGTSKGRPLATLANNLERKILTEGFDLRDISRRPFASKDGKSIVQRGDKVRYWNNVGEWSIGTVVAQLKPRKVGNKVYDDLVAVKFGDGRLGVLRSNFMDILGDDLDSDLNLHDKDSDLSDYKRNKSGQELRDARGFGYTFGDEERREDDNDDADPDDVVNTADTDAAAPYLGEQGEEADTAEPEDEPEDEEESEGNISSFEPGDIWPDENGDRMGAFVEAQKVTDPATGTTAWAVIWMDDDGDEQLELIPLDSSRVPK